MSREKVLLSVSLEDLKTIDANADAAGLSRSAYAAKAALEDDPRIAVLDVRTYVAIKALQELREAVEQFSLEERLQLS